MTRFPASGPSWRISADGGSQARWRRDGTEIFYLAPDRRLMAATVTERNGTMAVTRVDPLFTLTFPYGAYHAFDVSADGTRFLVNTVLGANAPTQQVRGSRAPEAARDDLQRLGERKEWMFFAALPRPAARSRLPGGPWWCCAACCRPSSRRDGALVAAVQRGDSLTPPLAVVGVGVRAAAGADADSNRGQPEPRRPHRRVPVRPADRRVRAAARDGTSRGSVADGRPDGGARLRPRHDRASAVLLDGLHCRRSGGDVRRPRGGGGPGRLRLVGAARARRRLARPRTGCCARAPSGTTATPTKSAARSATPTTPIGWPSIRRQQGAAPVRAGAAGPSTASSRGARGCTRCSTRRRGCASGRWPGAC